MFIFFLTERQAQCGHQICYIETPNLAFQPTDLSRHWVHRFAAAGVQESILEEVCQFQLELERSRSQVFMLNRSRSGHQVVTNHIKFFTKKHRSVWQ